MITQPGDACRRILPRWGVSTLSILLAGLCVLIVMCTEAAKAQTQSDLTSSTLQFHHFSGATAVVNYSAFAAASASLPDTDAVPIPGGIDIPPVIHIFAPGPTKLGFQGLDVEPNGITNFKGFSALAYLSGEATDNKNNKYIVGSDMRLYQGEYIAADGTHHRGTFVFI